MADIKPLDVEQLYRHICDSSRHGARASRLMRHVPAIIDQLYPVANYPHLSEYDRALRVETDIRTIIDNDIGGPSGEAIAAVLCLRPGTIGRTLEDRRRIAAGYLNIEAETFRRPPHEAALLFDLTIEIYRHHTTRQSDR